MQLWLQESNNTSLGPWRKCIIVSAEFHLMCMVSEFMIHDAFWGCSKKAVSLHAFVMISLRKVVDFLKPLNHRTLDVFPQSINHGIHVGFITWQQDKYSDEVLHPLTKLVSCTNFLTLVASLGQHLKIGEVCFLLSWILELSLSVA